MRNSLMTVGVIVTALSVAPACATKKFVRTSVGEVNDKVTTQGKSLEETQERVRAAEGRITETDAKATAAGDSASKANAAAAEAANRATEVGRTAETRATSIEGEMRKLIFETVLSEDRGEFKLGKAELPEDATGALDTMVNQLKTDKKAVWVEIEGHTDSTGDKKMNETLGLNARRSREAVSLREAPDPAAQDQRDQLRRREAGCAEQHPRRPRAEPPRRDQGPRLTGSD